MNVWSLLNVALLGLSVWTGYSEMAPEKLAHRNPDVIFCTVMLVGTIAFFVCCGLVLYFRCSAANVTSCVVASFFYQLVA